VEIGMIGLATYAEIVFFFFEMGAKAFLQAIN
jgi:hypothetical protein